MGFRAREELGSWTDEQWGVEISRVWKSVERDSAPPPSVTLDGGIQRHIDHTLLKLDATTEQIERLCQEAITYNFKTVCVRLPWVPQCIAALKGSNTGIACVVSFHEGTASVEEKVACVSPLLVLPGLHTRTNRTAQHREAAAAMSAGATELDVVLNHAAFTSTQPTPYAATYAAFSRLRKATEMAPGTAIKIILETSQLSPNQIAAVSVIAFYAGLDYVKTSTGFLGHGATVKDVKLMADVAFILNQEHGGRLKVKASGGIRDAKTAREMVDVGAERLGVSAGVAIVQGWDQQSTSSSQGGSGY